jgi:hypothetical protein
MRVFCRRLRVSVAVCGFFVAVCGFSVAVCGFSFTVRVFCRPLQVFCPRLRVFCRRQRVSCRRQGVFCRRLRVLCRRKRVFCRRGFSVAVYGFSVAFNRFSVVTDCKLSKQRVPINKKKTCKSPSMKKSKLNNIAPCVPSEMQYLDKFPGKKVRYFRPELLCSFLYSPKPPTPFSLHHIFSIHVGSLNPELADWELWTLKAVLRFLQLIRLLLNNHDKH